MLENLRSVKCLLILIAICVRRRTSFKEVLVASGVKRSTAWDCLINLERDGLVEIKKVLTLLGPRTLIECTEKGSAALRELKRALEEV